ncbi:MAG: glycosyltransferase [Promethearchaeia archaeon]
MPSINLSWLESLTDDTGILQHAKFSIANRKEGYTTDDNARALVAVLKHYDLGGKKSVLQFAESYLSFLLYMQRDDGNFHNFLGYNRSFLDDMGSHDSLGRVLWATGYTQDINTSDDFRAAAKEIFDKALVWALKSDSPRTQAFAILGLHHYAKAFPKDENPPLNISILADQLCERYRRESKDSWCWFESYLTYANPRLPQALFRAYQTTEKEEYLTIAKKTLDFLAEMDIVQGLFQPVGNRVWHVRGQEREIYDQQPIEASCMVEAAITAFRVTRQERYLEMAHTAFDWFMGRNSKGVMVYNPATGGCYDGITPEGVNRNQGAEAGLSFLLARLEMETLSKRTH